MTLHYAGSTKRIRFTTRLSPGNAVIHCHLPAGKNRIVVRTEDDRSAEFVTVITGPGEGKTSLM